MSQSHSLRVIADAPAALAQVALGWHERLRLNPSAAEQEAFQAWLAAEPAHVQAYAQVQALWELTEQPAQRLAREEAATLQQYLQAMAPPPRRALRGWLSALATAASVLLMLGLLGWQPQRWVDSLRADYVSAPGQLRQIVLADHSVLLLDADSAVQVHFTDTQRRVKLLRGAAYFQVSHTGLPFIVGAGDGEAQVLGTRFEVRLHEDGARVTVQSGRVAVTARAGQAPQVLGANQQVSYQQGLAGTVRSVDSDASLAWRQGWLTFYKVPLAQVLDEVQRYSPTRIVLLNTALGQRRISGSFPSQDPGKVLDSLASVVGFEHTQLLGLTVVR